MRAQASIATTTSGIIGRKIPTTSPVLDAAVLQRVGELLDVAVEVGVGDVALLALLAAPVERDAVAVAGLHVAVDAVVGDVELAADEPLGVRRVGPVEHLVPLLLPVEGLGLLLPEALVVLVRLVVDRLVGDDRLLAELVRGRERLLLEQLLELGSRASCCQPCRLLRPVVASRLRSTTLSVPGERLLGAEAGLRTDVQLVVTCARRRAPSRAPCRGSSRGSPSGIETIPGLRERTTPIGEPVSVSAPGHTFGELTMIRPIALTTPNSTPVTAPVVLKRRQRERQQQRREVRARGDREREADHERHVQALAADDGDRRSRSRRSRARRSSRPGPPRCSESLPLRMMLDQMSCATALDADSTRPATTARIVANATPAMSARNRSPPNVPSPPPSTCGQVRRREVAALARGLDAALPEERARAEADERRQQVEEADHEHRPDDRAARGLGVRDGEEPHQDVRQARRAEHEREPERDGVDRLRQERARAERERRAPRPCPPPRPG